MAQRKKTATVQLKVRIKEELRARLEKEGKSELARHLDSVAPPTS